MIEARLHLISFGMRMGLLPLSLRLKSILSDPRANEGPFTRIV
jgi:hypothetical protein